MNQGSAAVQYIYIHQHHIRRDVPSQQTIIPTIAPAAMSSNKFDALGSDDSEVEESLNNHHQMEVDKNQTKKIW